MGVSKAWLSLRPHLPQIGAIQPHGPGLGGVLCGRFVPRVVSDPCLPLRQRACPGEAGSIVCASCSLLGSTDRIILLNTRPTTPHHRTPHRRASPSAAPSAWPLGLALARRLCRTRPRRTTITNYSSKIFTSNNRLPSTEYRVCRGVTWTLN